MNKISNVTQIKQKLPVIKCAEKNVYGRMLIYVTDQKQAKMLAALTHKSTLDYRDLEALESLGFEIHLTHLPA
jgi:hypothetical protein